MRIGSLPRCSVLCCFWVVASLASFSFASDFPPISTNELALKENPVTPGFPAVILDEEVESLDKYASQTSYIRIKIFGDEGRKYGNVQIPYLQGRTGVDDIRARTIRPDGSVVEFKGEVFEKAIARSREERFMAKVFSLPEVEPGCIIEYTFRSHFQEGAGHTWIIEHELPILRIHFTWRPTDTVHYENRVYHPSTRWVTYLPKGKSVEQKSGAYELTMENVPAFEKEESMPPERVLKSRVEFYYVYSNEDAKDFWKNRSKAWSENLENFVGHHKAIEEETARAISSNDAPEEKLRKIYQRVQQIRNLSFELRRSEKQAKQEALKPNTSVEDVLKHGYGTGYDIIALFISMARAAGFEATMARVAGRGYTLFEPELLDVSQLSAEVAVVRVGNEDRFYDPGTKYCPYDLLPWSETQTKGIRVQKDREEFVETPLMPSSKAVLTRKAVIKYEADGHATGTVSLMFAGQEALGRRIFYRNADDTQRQKERENALKEVMPPGTEVKLQKVGGWDATEEPLHEEYSVEIPGFGSTAGRRTFLPLELFQAKAPARFQPEIRKYPVYFRYRYQVADDIQVQLPEGFSAETLPKGQDIHSQLGTYKISWTKEGTTIRVKRDFSLEALLIPVQYYPAVRSFYTQIKAGDDDNAVVQSQNTAAAK